MNVFIRVISKRLLFITCTGPSGVGKGRLVKALLYDYNRFFSKVVTHTTRNPRREEVNGTNYHFIPLDRYHELVSEGNYFLEHAQVHNNFYGVSSAAWESVTNSGKIPILEIDIQGAKVIREKATSLGIAPKYLFIAPPSLGMLVRVHDILFDLSANSNLNGYAYDCVLAAGGKTHSTRCRECG